MQELLTIGIIVAGSLGLTVLAILGISVLVMTVANKKNKKTLH